MSENGVDGTEKTMDELMAELESGDDGLDAFDKMLDQAASEVVHAHGRAEKVDEGSERSGGDAGSDGSATSSSSKAILVSNDSSEPSIVSCAEGDQGNSTPPSGSSASKVVDDLQYLAGVGEGSSPMGMAGAAGDPGGPGHQHVNRVCGDREACQPTQGATLAAEAPRTPPTPGGGTFSLGGLFASAVATAEAARASADEIIKDGTIGTKVNQMLSIAGEELYSTTYDLSAAARAGNSKILIKPQASFGVQLELIAGRECGDPEAEVCSEAVEGIITILESHHLEHGRLSASLFTRHMSARDRDWLASVKDLIDCGVPLTNIDLGDDAVAAAADLLRLFLLDLPSPLLTHSLYDDFIAASYAGEGAMSDVAQRLPPPHRAAARRILSFLYSAVIQDAPNRRAVANTLAVAIGPSILRGGGPVDPVVILRDAAQWRDAVSACLCHAEEVFAHSCWFLGPWLGVYSLECLESMAPNEVAAGFTVKGGVGSLSQLEIDATGIRWAGTKAKPGSEVNASHWERNRDVQDYNPSMVVAAKFEDDTVIFSFEGSGPWQGMSTVEQIVIEPSPNGGLQERVVRRFEGRYMKPLRWEAALDDWGRKMVKEKWEDRKHAMMLHELWTLTFPEDDAPSKVHDDWRRLGFSSSPREDFSGDGGMLCLDVLIHLGEHHNPKYKAMLKRSQGVDDSDSYPFARTVIRVFEELLRGLKIIGEAAGDEVGGAWELHGKETVACRRSLGVFLLAGGNDQAPADISHAGNAFGRVLAAAMAALDATWATSPRSVEALDAAIGNGVSAGVAALRSLRPQMPLD